MIALALLLASQAADPVAVAAVGLSPVKIEDDNGPDMDMVGIGSAGCTVTLSGSTKTFAIDLRQTQSIALEDTFVYVAAGPIKLAIVGDASQPAQAAKLKALNAALIAVAKRCTPPR